MKMDAPPIDEYYAKMQSENNRMQNILASVPEGFYLSIEELIVFYRKRRSDNLAHKRAIGRLQRELAFYRDKYKSLGGEEVFNIEEIVKH